MTESLLADDLGGVAARMTAMKDIGMRFSLDAFGTGYCSLAYVKRLPFDVVKIDRSFIHDVLDDENDAAIVRAIVAMGNSLRLKLIAEGVEIEEQWAFLLQEGCHGGQGHLFGHPMPVEQLEAAWIRAIPAAARAQARGG
jgi:EAL domain-containing protein (putative c-di-GMP-specific phosphodiesterase class I)